MYFDHLIGPSKWIEELLYRLLLVGKFGKVWRFFRCAGELFAKSKGFNRNHLRIVDATFLKFSFHYLWSQIIVANF